MALSEEYKALFKILKKHIPSVDRLENGGTYPNDKIKDYQIIGIILSSIRSPDLPSKLDSSHANRTFQTHPEVMIENYQKVFQNIQELMNLINNYFASIFPLLLTELTEYVTHYDFIASVLNGLQLDISCRDNKTICAIYVYVVIQCIASQQCKTKKQKTILDNYPLYRRVLYAKTAPASELWKNIASVTAQIPFIKEIIQEYLIPVQSCKLKSFFFSQQQTINDKIYNRVRFSQLFDDTLNQKVLNEFGTRWKQAIKTKNSVEFKLKADYDEIIQKSQANDLYILVLKLFSVIPKIDYSVLQSFVNNDSVLIKYFIDKNIIHTENYGRKYILDYAYFTLMEYLEYERYKNEPYRQLYYAADYKKLLDYLRKLYPIYEKAIVCYDLKKIFIDILCQLDFTGLKPRYNVFLSYAYTLHSQIVYSSTEEKTNYERKLNILLYERTD